MFVSLSFTAVLAFIYVSYSTNYQVMYDWLSAVIVVQLITVLMTSIFSRSRLKHTKKSAGKWQRYALLILVVNNLVFSAAYAFLLFSVQSINPALVCLLLGMQFCINAMVNSISMTHLLATSTALLLAPMVVLIQGSQVSNILDVGVLAISAALVLFVSFGMTASFRKSMKARVEISELRESNSELRNLLDKSSVEDSVTGIYNRKFFDLIFNHEVRRAKRNASVISLMLIEISQYDELVSNYDDTKMDKLLATMSKKLSDSTLRGGEFLTRFDESKFAIILPNIDGLNANKFADKLLNVIENSNIQMFSKSGQSSVAVSVNIGISEFKKGQIIDVSELLSQAQYALKTSSAIGLNTSQIFAQNVVPNHVKETKGKAQTYIESEESSSDAIQSGKLKVVN